MKIPLLLLILILSSSTLFSMTGIADNGRKVELRDDYTWSYIDEEAKLLQQGILAEANLFKLAIRESKPILYDQYLENYEGIDIKNTISLVYYYIKEIESFYAWANSQNEKYIELLKKGILYTEQYGKIFIIKNPINGVAYMSNLAFFWDYAILFESQEMYQEALSMYLKLEKYFIETNQQFLFTYPDSSLEVVQGKIYLLNLLCSQ